MSFDTTLKLDRFGEIIRQKDQLKDVEQDLHKEQYSARITTKCQIISNQQVNTKKVLSYTNFKNIHEH